MNKYCIFALIFLYLEIFSGQTTGLNYIEYDCEYSYPICLTISDVRVQWETANSTCAMHGGRLFDPISNVIKFPQNNGGEYYWTEFHRVRNNGHFQTTDGYPLPYSYHNHWEYNHPNDSIDCVGYDGESNELLSLECNTTHLAVCQIGPDNCVDLKEYKGLCSYLTELPEILTENTLRNLFSNFNVTTGDFMKFYNNKNDLLVTQVSANTTTEISGNEYSIQISGDSSEARKTFVWRVPYVYTGYYGNSNFRASSEVIIVYTNNNSSEADLTIEFSDHYSYDFYFYYYTDEDQCVHLTSDGNWSTEGVETKLNSRNSIQCTTKFHNISTISVGRRLSSYFQNSFETNISLNCLCGIISFISLLFLLSSVIIFIASGKKFFLYDINILHFNNTLSLFIAIICLPFIVVSIYVEYGCLLVSFFLHFLWMNVFLSSLSIAISVFYSVWIVSINRTGKKLSKYLIPIGWIVSLLLSGVWALVGYFRGEDSIICITSNRIFLRFDWPILVPMIAILLTNTALLIASLFKVWLVLRKQSSQQGELKRLRKVVISGILLMPALGLPFIALLCLLLYIVNYQEFDLNKDFLPFIIIILFTSPIGIIHFILITCQIRESVIRKCWCCCCCRITSAKIAQSLHSLHLNIVRPKPKPKNHKTHIEESTIQQIPIDTIPNSVPSNDSAVFSVDSTQAAN